MLPAWHLVLGLSVVLLWCVVGWQRAQKAKPEVLPVEAPPPPRTTFVEDIRASLEEPVDDVVARWRGRLPQK